MLNNWNDLAGRLRIQKNLEGSMWRQNDSMRRRYMLYGTDDHMILNTVCIGCCPGAWTDRSQRWRKWTSEITTAKNQQETTPADWGSWGRHLHYMLMQNFSDCLSANCVSLYFMDCMYACTYLTVRDGMIQWCTGVSQCIVFQYTYRYSKRSIDSSIYQCITIDQWTVFFCTRGNYLVAI